MLVRLQSHLKLLRANQKAAEKNQAKTKVIKTTECSVSGIGCNDAGLNGPGGAGSVGP
jgi:hypothetical protein